MLAPGLLLKVSQLDTMSITPRREMAKIETRRRRRSCEISIDMRETFLRTKTILEQLELETHIADGIDSNLPVIRRITRQTH